MCAHGVRYTITLYILFLKNLMLTLLTIATAIEFTGFLVLTLNVYTMLSLLTAIFFEC